METKIASFDKAFLFVIGSAQLITAYITIVLGINNQLEAIPFLLLGIALPFYIGYVRGAISVNKIEERIRGWIYFTVGMFSYFGFAISSKFSGFYGQALFDIFLIMGVIVSYFIIIKWAKRTFNIRGVPIHYSYSGTALCSFGVAFTIRIFYSLSIDFVNNNFLNAQSIFSAETLFWFTVVLGAITFALLMEKISRRVLFQQGLEFPEMKNGKILTLSKNLVRGALLATLLLEFAIDTTSKTWFLWTEAFAFWVLGCFFWKVGFPILPILFFALTLALGLSAGIIFYNKKTIDFKNVQCAFPTKSGYCGVIFVITFIILYYQLNFIGTLYYIIWGIIFTVAWWKVAERIRAQNHT